MTVKQSGRTQGESDCNCLLLVPPEKYSIVAQFSMRFRRGFWPVFWPKSARHAALVFQLLFGLFSCFLVCFGYVLVFLPLLSTPEFFVSS